MNTIEANNPELVSWVKVPSESDFPIQNLPFGIFSKKGKSERSAASAIGDFVIDLAWLQDNGFFSGIHLPTGIFRSPSLNPFIALGKTVTNAVRNRLSEILRASNPYQRADSAGDQFLIPKHEVEMKLSVEIGDYTDFYSSREHATNVGMMFRDPENALLPNWLHLPVGYHGRSSSIVVSGTPIQRPNGQMLPPEGGSTPVFGPSKRLDFELEMGFIIGKNTDLGQPVDVNQAHDHIFGLVLFNDWSARDIQQWEYVPLGPFLGKNFASTMSPWIVTIEALEPFRTNGPVQEVPVLPYLKNARPCSYDIHLELELVTENGIATSICKTNFKYMYWSMCQQLAHHTVNGCNIRVGDLMASGTISGKEHDSYGSMLELAWKGTKPVQLADGTERKFLQDGDTVRITGWGSRAGVRVGFGEASGKITPAR